MANPTKLSIVPEPSGSYDDEAWSASVDAVGDIQAETVANTAGLSDSIEAKTQALREQTHTLKSLRLIRQLTQQQLAAKDKRFSQAQVSGIEKNDPLALVVETLQRYVEASGGKLEIRAIFEDAVYPLDFSKPSPGST